MPLSKLSAAIVISVMGSTLPVWGVELSPDKIVGLGATNCAQYTKDTSASVEARREYLAWAQGFLSAVLITRPPGVDDGLNLAPDQLPLQDQASFLQSHCARFPENSFSQAVETLYLRLRTVGKTN